MFEQELEELHSLSEIDLIGKKYYLETGNYLSRQTVTRSMIKQFVQLEDYWLIWMILHNIPII